MVLASYAEKNKVFTLDYYVFCFVLLGHALDQLYWLNINFNLINEAFNLHNISNNLGFTCSFISYKEPNPTQPWNLASADNNFCHSTRAVMGTSYSRNLFSGQFITLPNTDTKWSFSLVLYQRFWKMFVLLSFLISFGT